MSNGLHHEMIRFSRPQARVLTLQQAMDLGASDTWVLRQVNRGIWQRLYPGIYLTDSAKPSWFSRAQAAVFLGGPGAYLSHEAAWFLNRIQPHPPAVITVSVSKSRYLKPRDGIKFFRRNAAPRVRGVIPHSDREHTVLDLIAAATNPVDVIGYITAGMRVGMNPNRILKVLELRCRFPHRSLVKDLLGESGRGVESPLEYLYDHRVERAHGLPASLRQKPEKVNGRWIRADRIFAKYLVRVELDGQLAHPGGRTNIDTWRDNAVLVKHGEVTLRYRWLHIVGNPCQTAGQIAAALRNRGWSGKPKRCGPTCTSGSYNH